MVLLQMEAEQMKEVIFNGSRIHPDEISLSISNRAFRYGDALFETMHLEGGKVRFLDRHMERMQKGLKAMQLELPERFDSYPAIIEDYIQNHDLNNGTLRWQVWRKDGGKYSPSTNGSESLVEFMPWSEIPEEIKLGISNTSNVTYHPLSAYKTSNALPYVLAGIEKNNSDEYNDLILLDSIGNVSECIASNIFWSNNKHWYTPSLETGCVDGIMRNHVLEKMKEAKTPLKIGEYGIEYFLDIQKAFITNSRGIFLVSVLGELRLSDHLNLPQDLESLRVR